MSGAARVQIPTTGSLPLANAPGTRHTVRRKCACGSSAASGKEVCEDCTQKRLRQGKLAIGATNDPLEQEADRVADQVLSTWTDSTQRALGKRVQRSSDHPPGDSCIAPASVELALSSPGKPLGLSLRRDMEQRLGCDFSRVRVHSGSAAERSAKDIHAHAYTVGTDIVFGAGRFAPDSRDGRRLIAHELTHVMQQSDEVGGNADRTYYGPSPRPIARGADRKVMKKGFESTIKVCQRVLESRHFEVTKGGLRVVLVLTSLDRTVPGCRDFDFGVTLTRSEDWSFDHEVATCQAATGGTRSFSFANVPAGTYYLKIWRTFDHQYCCLEGDILVFDEPVSRDATGCTRDEQLSAMDIVHGALDLAGFVPVLGALPDGINAAIYVVEGDWANAGLSAVAMVPAWGDGVMLGAIAGKSAIKISEKAAIRLGEEGIAKGLKEVKAASKVEKAVVEAGEDASKLAKVEKGAVEGAAKGETKAASRVEKEAAEALQKRIEECLAIYALYKGLGDCPKCKGTDTAQERAAKIACLTAEIAGRRAYLAKNCDDVLPGSIERKNRGQDPLRGHQIQLAEKIQSLAKCATLPTK